MPTLRDGLEITDFLGQRYGKRFSCVGRVQADATTGYDYRVKAGSLTIAPPLSADSCADSPTQVQLAD